MVALHDLGKICRSLFVEMIGGGEGSKSNLNRLGMNQLIELKRKSPSPIYVALDSAPLQPFHPL